jgi:hypothetical protein
LVNCRIVGDPGRAGMGWAAFLVMRRAHATPMNELGVNGKPVADQPAIAPEVSQSANTQSPVESRLPAGQQREKSLLEMWPAGDANGAQTQHRLKQIAGNC